MAYEIPAALIGGSISGAVVLAGIGITERLTRKHERESSLLSDFKQLYMLLPVALSYLGPQPPDSRRLTMASPGWEVDQRVTALMTGMEITARGMRGRRAIRLRAAIDDLNARYVAAKLRTITGSPLSMSETLNITTVEVGRTLLRRRKPFDDLVKHYLEHGFDSSPPPSPK